VDCDLGKDLLPEVGSVIIHDEDGNEPGVEHLDEIFVLERIRRLLEPDGQLLFSGKALIQLEEVLVIAR